MAASEQATLTEEERGPFERLRERHPDDDVGKIADVVLQSADNEEAKS